MTSEVLSPRPVPLLEKVRDEWGGTRGTLGLAGPI